MKHTKQKTGTAKKERTIQINYWTMGGFEGEKPLETVFQQAAKMGYTGVEPTFDTKALGPGVTKERCQEIRKSAKANGLKIETLCTGKYWQWSLSDTRKSIRAKAVAYTKEYLQVAKWLGAKTVLVVPGAVAIPWDPATRIVPYQEAWKLSQASLRQCLPLAQELKINIGLENVWNWFLADPIAMKTFIDELGSPRIGSYLDVGNCAVNGKAEHWIEILGRKRIKAIHVKNFTGSDGAGGLHGFGEKILVGDVDMQSIKKALDAIKYAGPITAEMIPFCRLPDLNLPDVALARKTAKSLLKVF